MLSFFIEVMHAQMNHQKIYNNIISNAKSQNRMRFKKNDPKYVYYEDHHIVAKCLGGSNDRFNRILLTAREHYVCHKLLTYIYKGNRKITLAFHRMTFDKHGRDKISSRDYVYARELLSNTPISEETRKKRSKSMIGKNVGRKHTTQQNKKKSERMKGKRPNNCLNI
jgi:hypothetical protein